MSFFINDAWAEAAPAAGDPSGFASLVPLILIFVIFYFLLLRPQIKRAKEHKQMVGSLTKGDEVVTSGGLLGRIVKVDDNFVSLEVADGVRVKVQKSAVTSLMPKGTFKGGEKSSGKQGKGKKAEQAALKDESEQAAEEGADKGENRQDGKSG